MTGTSQAEPGWLEIVIQAPAVTHEALCSFLFDLDCQGLMVPDLPHDPIKGYFPASIDVKALHDRLVLFSAELGLIFPEAGAVSWDVNPLPMEDWANNWRQFFKSDKITTKLMIVPAWEKVPEQGPAMIIRMDPGPAFGTGQHPTTRMCLAAMEAPALKPGWSLLDVGTGSGILAIYGAKLGAGRILALDNDPEALQWAQRNIALNQVPQQIVLSGQPLEHCGGAFDVVTANLILGTILELMPFFPARLAPAGRLILSGLLIEQVPEVMIALERNGLEVQDQVRQQEWTSLIVRRKSGCDKKF